MHRLFPIKLIDTLMLTPDVKHFIFSIDKEHAFTYLPGQFITLHIKSHERTLKRSYSIANPPLQNNLIEFAAGYVRGGMGSELLFNLSLGDSIMMSGPFGRLVLKDNTPKRYVLIATSTGITPYRAMIPALKQRLSANENLNILIMQGVQTDKDVLYKEELLEFCNLYQGRVKFRMQLSRAHDNELQPHQYQGYVQHAFSEISLNPTEDLVYLCGNPSMIDESFEQLKTQGFLPAQIIREKYISSP